MTRLKQLRLRRRFNMIRRHQYVSALEAAQFWRGNRVLWFGMACFADDKWRARNPGHEYDHLMGLE